MVKAFNPKPMRVFPHTKRSDFIQWRNATVSAAGIEKLADEIQDLIDDLAKIRESGETWPDRLMGPSIKLVKEHAKARATMTKKINKFTPIKGNV